MMVLSQKRIPNLWKTNPAFYSNESEGQLGVPDTVASLDLLHLSFQSSHANSETARPMEKRQQDHHLWPTLSHKQPWQW